MVKNGAKGPKRPKGQKRPKRLKGQKQTKNILNRPKESEGSKEP